ncbi:TetR family transcriptional regulator [Pelagibacterium sp. H642]|uniref:TetR/AcrR family transcriptional regulator n=1 Tax=Pelagibacterium sp. H642 TaxID=1881069 RepID=UPI0028163D8E|nr:TetR family transcriptional regulator [Pelagibacterium sp. H642]WMT89166.1 TetR family transcriptional regulator [Pelagibacterium sp. H642]
MGRDAQATRARLVAAARQAFSEHGYERTTVRQIAAEAGVNQALINRYFGGKEQLFAEAVSIDLELPDLAGVARAEVGQALAAHFFRRWEGEETDDLLRVLIRTAATNAEAAARIRSIFAGQILRAVESIAGAERARERAALIATQILGLAYARYVLGLTGEDISRETIRAMVGGTLERYLFDPLP